VEILEPGHRQPNLSGLGPCAHRGVHDAGLLRSSAIFQGDSQFEHFGLI
jgi:hypothetical protein